MYLGFSLGASVGSLILLYDHVGHLGWGGFGLRNYRIWSHGMDQSQRPQESLELALNTASRVKAMNATSSVLL
jgi:hypothetical protein